MDLDYLEKQLTRHEGRRNILYRDSNDKMTIGIGHNIEDKGLRDSEIELIFSHDLQEAINDLTAHLDWTNSLDQARRMVLVNMCFNMGVAKLLGFHKMLVALQNGDFNKAADEMMNSLWAKQVKGRALELANQMRTGELL